MVSINLPPALQQVGVLPLSTPDLNSFASENDPSDASDPGTSSGGGGSFTDGTLENVSIDDTQVVFTLSGTNLFDDTLGDGVADGTYTALRCP